MGWDQVAIAGIWRLKNPVTATPLCDICGISIRGATVTGLISIWFLMWINQSLVSDAHANNVKYPYKSELVNASIVCSTASKTKA